jgi:tetratricopeptide (TPR) repeat protein
MDKINEKLGVVEIPIGRRIGEIMEEKGAAFSIRGFSQRIGLSKDMLARMLSGDRHVTPSELEQIAKGLSVSISRLKQEDTRKEREELLFLIRNNTNIMQAVRLAKKLVPLALGVTEKCRAYDQLGSALYMAREYDEAHEAWLEAYSYAEKIHERYTDKDTLFNVLTHLILSYTHRKEYTYLSGILKNIEPILGSDPSRAAVIYYSLAKIVEEIGDYDGAKEKYYQSLRFYKLTNHLTNIGIAKHFTAAFEYRMGNYETAIQMFQDALKDLVNYQYGQLLCQKEYVKTLLKVGEEQQAKTIVIEALDRINSNAEQYAELRAQYSILMARITNDPKYAENVLNGNVDHKIKSIAAQFLINYYDENDDSELVMKYYRVIKAIKQYRDVLDEEDL